MLRLAASDVHLIASYVFMMSSIREMKRASMKWHVTGLPHAMAFLVASSILYTDSLDKTSDVISNTSGLSGMLRSWLSKTVTVSSY